MISATATAAPISLNLLGIVSDGTGNWAGDAGTAFSADTTFDLDETNAFAKEVISPAGEAPFTRWTYFNPVPFTPYGAGFSGAFGAFSKGTVSLELIDNIDADAEGNPFGITGIVDVLTITGSNVVVDCSAGTVDPVTGCSDPDAPLLFGEEFLINLVAANDWFSGNDVLPTSLSPPQGLIAIFGEGEQITGGLVTATITIDFNSSQVPEPATILLFGLGLAGLGLARRRRPVSATGK